MGQTYDGIDDRWSAWIAARLHRHGEVVPPEDCRLDTLVRTAGFAESSDPAARRAIIRVDVERIADSCGYGVPLMDLRGERPHHPLSVEKKLRTEGPDGPRRYQDAENAASIDGLPAVPARVSG